MPNKNLIYISVFSFFIPLFANGQSATETLFVDGVCGMCKDRIEAAALQSKGVESADWDLESHQLTVTYDPTEFKFNRLQRQLADVGHDTDKYEAPQEAYDQLHSCCKYRDPEIIASHQPAPAPSAAAIFVNGICGMCKDRIEAAALHTQGVKTASWNLSTRMLYVDVDPDVFSEDQLHWAVTAVGHDTREWLANDAAYQSLDDCCKYRELADPVPAEDPVFQDIALLDQFISGTIFESAGRNKKAPLVGVNIYWEDTKSGTFTDENGHFEMARNTENQLLVVSYVGYAPDTIDMSDQVAFELMLSEAVTLDAVEVNYRRKSSDISFIDPIKTLQIDQKELLKAACCNLSESFETNPSVDVSFTDAVTGTRQIQMLGLAGPYVQITQESMPGARALSSIQGLTYIPGPWISGIQLIKGPGSVVNGYESMTGQINVELKKPENSERLYVNLYANEGGRFEANINSAVRLNEKVSTGILLHGNMSRQMNDRNTDGFLDNPIGNNFIAINRWKFENINGWNGQIGIKATLIDKASGQLSENYDTQFSIDNPLWTMIQNTARYEIWAKMGRVFPNNPTSSIGFQASGVMHEQTFSFGSIGAKKLYEPNQKSAYFNMIYQGLLGNPIHQFKTGLSFQIDDIQETMVSELFNSDLVEYVPGAFFEYTYQPTEKFTTVLGLRGDYSNFYGAFMTPRLHIRYALAAETVLRLSAGRGQRRPVLFMDQIGALASNRYLFIEQNPNSEIKPYGLDPEVSWNFGLNLTQNISLANRELLVSADAYHTFFTSQIVADYDNNAQSLFFYNLDGRSYSNSLQIQLDYEILSRWDVRLAYRFNDVQITYKDGFREMPFVARHRSFINTSYETIDGWGFDLTLNWQGSKRIPDTYQNPEAFRLDSRSPNFFLLNGQISKSFKKTFDVYVGVENALNFVQENPIISAEDPSSPYFDSSLIWGPVFGRMLYTGVRYRIN